MEIKPKVYDVFTMWNELDMLEIRLNILDPYVDYFVLTEGSLTWMGEKKGSFYLDNKERFAKWNHKIIHHFCDDYPNDKELFDLTLSSPCTGAKEQHWLIEFYTKESVKKSLTHLNDEDIVYVSDIDEIWNPHLKLEWTDGVVFKPKQLPYLFYLNKRTDESWFGWTGTTICKYKTIKNGVISHIRTDGMQKYTILENGGWHFCSLGSIESKKQNDKHPMYQDDATWKRRMINMRKEEKDLPEYILNNKEKWKQYLL